jgi:hypothetical protein
VAIDKLAVRCRNSKIGCTTVGLIRSAGYDVVVTSGVGLHATVVVPRDWDASAALTLGATFEELPNPIPKERRLR